ncbi:hypothetical protein [Palleronia rufa]|uniref:hypothetical protein n=1 Tax=Palleronia rufa TaxID=1530186 RepID=UPI00056C698F|nr:hypothetical protein [Palleronia rufa]
MRPPAETTAIFVADGAAMQAQGLLLAHSLRRHGGAGLAVIAYVPEGAEPPDAAMRAGYAAVGARLEPLETPAIWKKPFPHGNKIHACCAARDRPATLFLDTDTVLIRALDTAAIAPGARIAAVPEGKPTWGKDNDRWDRVYAHFGLPLPSDRVRLVRGRRRTFLPYFNAGFIAFAEDGAFARGWRDTAWEIDHKVSVAQKRPWLDQVALPVSCARAGRRIGVLDERYNYSISDRAPGNEAPVLLHYHRMSYCAAWPAWSGAYAALRSDLGADLPRAARAVLDRGLPDAADG